MKILFLTNIPSPYRVEFFSMLGLYCDLTVIYELKYATNRDKKWKVKIDKTYNEIFLDAKRTIYDGGISFKIIKYLKKEKYDFIVVGTHGTPTAKIAMLYMRIMRIPYVLNIDGCLTYTLFNKSKINLLLRKYLFRGAKYYLTTNEETIKYLLYFGINKNKIFKYRFSSIKEKDIISFSVDKEKIKKELLIKEKRIILSVGQYIYRKGFDILLKAMKNIQDINGLEVGIYIIGGTITDEYKKIISEYNLKNIHFISFKKKEELEKYYQVADIFILPTRHDEWGLVINEALAKGIPIITTNHCGSGLELIENMKNGFLIPTDDVEALTKKINILFSDNILLEKIRKNNILLAKSYTLENMVKDHMKFFEEH